MLRTAASKQLGNAIVPHISNRPLRINVKQLTMPQGMCNICFHESNSLDNMRHMWRDCPNRRNVCAVCHKDSHTTEECGYVDALIEYEPETQVVPEPVRRGTLTAYNLQSRADRRERQQRADEISHQSRRTLVSQSARAKKLYSSSEDEENDGELATNPEWAASAVAGGPSQPFASAAPAWSPLNDSPPHSPPLPGPPGVEVAPSITPTSDVSPHTATPTPHRSVLRPPPPLSQGPSSGRPQPLPHENVPPPPSPLRPTLSDEV